MTAEQLITSPLTFEQAMAIIREDNRLANLRLENLFREAREAQEKEIKAAEKRLRKSLAEISDSIGEIITTMVEGNILRKFRKFGYNFTMYTKSYRFKNYKLGLEGEIDLFLEDETVAMLVEVKTTLETKDVKRHLERIAEFRRFADARGDCRRFVAAVAGAVVKGEAAKVAHQNGLYVIVQSGTAVKIAQAPRDFQPRVWG